MSRKAKLENFITRFARYYTPVVTIGAALMAVIPPLTGLTTWSESIYRACSFLIVSCPCALVISVPLGFFGGIGAASKIGVLVKGSNYLEAASRLNTLVMDKTGTLTKGEFKVQKVMPAKEAGLTEQDLLMAAAHVEGYSTHPIALSIREAYESRQDAAMDLKRVSDYHEIPGYGIQAAYDGRELFVGSARLMEQHGIKVQAPPSDGVIGTILHVAADGRYAGSIVIADSIKDGAREAIADMKKAGITRTVMLTGDRKEAALSVAAALGIDEVRSDLLPADKVAAVEALMDGHDGSRDSYGLGFVGDGINDAPVLMRADVGFAMGSLGSDAAIEAADIVLMDDDIRKIASVIRIAGKTMSIVRTNIVFALAVKIGILIMSALGVASMWLAVFADVGVAVLCILNSMRALRTR